MNDAIETFLHLTANALDTSFVAFSPNRVTVERRKMHATTDFSTWAVDHWVTDASEKYPGEALVLVHEAEGTALFLALGLNS